MRFKFFPLALAVILLAGLCWAETVTKLEGVRQMETAEMDIMASVWSPDGSALVMTEAKYQGIYLMDIQTGKITAITREAPAGYRLAFSPDGRYIAYQAVVDPSSIQKTVKLADTETGEIHALSRQSNQVGTPSWFPDGRIGYTFEGSFLIVNIKGEVEQTIADIASHVAPVSPDGEWILYNDRQDAIWAYHLIDGERFQVTPDGRRFFNPVWSPNVPAAIVNELGGSFYLVDVSQGTMVQLDDGNHYAWSPDGEKIVYDITRDDGHYITAADIYIINKDGSGKLALTFTVEGLEMYPSWSVDDHITFSRPDGKLFTAHLLTR